MNADLLSETISAYFAGHVDAVMGEFVSITAREFDAAKDTCTVWTTQAKKDVAHSVFVLERRLKMRTNVTEVTIYVTHKGLSIVLKGCIDEYKKWSQRQLRLRSPERFIYLLIGALVAAFFIYVLDKKLYSF